MWIRYIGKKTYNSMDVREFKPDTSRSVPEVVGNHLLAKFPKLFKPTKPVPVEVVKVEEAKVEEAKVEEVKVEEEVKKDKK